MLNTQKTLQYLTCRCKASPRLYQFLEEHNETATHFFIGTNILNNPQIFEQALEVSQDIAGALISFTQP